MHWRRGKTAVQNSLQRSESMWEKPTYTHQGQSRRRERRCSRHWTRDSPAALENTMVRQDVPLNPWRSKWEQISSCSSRRAPFWSKWLHGGGCDCDHMLEQAPGRTCGPVERGACAGEVLLAGFVPPWEVHAGAGCTWELNHVEGTHAGSYCEELQLLVWTNIGKACEGLSMWEIMHFIRRRMWGVPLLRRKEHQRQHVMNWL